MNQRQYEIDNAIANFTQRLSMNHIYDENEKKTILNEIKNYTKTINNINDVNEIMNIIAAFDLIVNGFQQYKLNMYGDNATLEKTLVPPPNSKKLFVKRMQSFLLDMPLSGLYVKSDMGNNISINKDYGCPCLKNIKYIQYIASGRETSTFEIEMKGEPKVIKLTDLNKVGPNGMDMRTVFTRSKNIGQLLYQNGLTSQLTCYEICKIDNNQGHMIDIGVVITEKMNMTIADKIKHIFNEYDNTHDMDKLINELYEVSKDYYLYVYKVVEVMQNNNVMINDMNLCGIMYGYDNKLYLVDWMDFEYFNGYNNYNDTLSFVLKHLIASSGSHWDILDQLTIEIGRRLTNEGIKYQ